jgi:hypothetical protein
MKMIFSRPKLKRDFKLHFFLQESLKSEEIAASKPAKDFHAADLKDLKSAIASLGGKNSEAQEIKILKKELEDYEEDLKDLHKVKKDTSPELSFMVIAILLRPIKLHILMVAQGYPLGMRLYVSLSLCLAFVSLPLLVWQQLEIHRFSLSLTFFSHR